MIRYLLCILLSGCCYWKSEESLFALGSVASTKAMVIESDDYIWWGKYSGIFQLLGIFILSLLALYRREMSSNRMYHVKDEKGKNTVDEEDSLLDEIVMEQLLDPFLEGAGRVCSGGPFSAMMMALVQNISNNNKQKVEKEESSNDIQIHQKRRMDIILFKAALQWLQENGVVFPPSSPQQQVVVEEQMKICNNVICRNNNSLSPPMLLFMPLDIWTQVSSFLHPKDVVTISMVNRILNKIVLHNEVLWYMLWKRDFSVLITNWDVGQKVLERSLPWNCPLILETHLKSLLPSTIISATTTTTTTSTNRDSMMDFYFQFGQSWINHFLAGYTGGDNRKCFTGLHGHVFDITHFMHSHPGSLETLIVHAGGKDASQFFEDVGHSKAARRMANSQLLTIFNPRTVSSTNTTTTYTSLQINTNRTLNNEFSALPMMRKTRPIQSGTLHRIWKQYQKEQHLAQKLAQTTYDHSLILGHANVYFDSFRGKWYSWSLNLEMEPILHPMPLFPDSQ